VSIELPSPNPLVSLTAINGAFTVTANGAFGLVAGTVALAPGLGFTFTGTFKIGFNTLTAPVTIDVNGDTIPGDSSTTADDVFLPAATVVGQTRTPYVALIGKGIQLNLGTVLSVSGDFTFIKNGPDIQLTFSGVSIALPNPNPIVTLSGVSGTFNVTTAGVYGAPLCSRTFSAASG